MRTKAISQGYKTFGIPKVEVVFMHCSFLILPLVFMFLWVFVVSVISLFLLILHHAQLLPLRWLLGTKKLLFSRNDNGKGYIQHDDSFIPLPFLENK